ncbi:MAG: hypothetical protein Sylvanvirus25_6 [Sylvanvirus sp.]|uniref:t-SNARE coiled-coil homology domain-containing protein n=1 Tax=Sylvanvirus sp. TaxID=2487774 RepID=A0A3G5AJS9_9VIRU|nr:MAG: hypothetical protein Sylvanvirus25_6 [Sylvanvirus sp.]
MGSINGDFIHPINDKQAKEDEYLTTMETKIEHVLTLSQQIETQLTIQTDLLEENEEDLNLAKSNLEMVNRKIGRQNNKSHWYSSMCLWIILLVIIALVLLILLFS